MNNIFAMFCYVKLNPSKLHLDCCGLDINFTFFAQLGTKSLYWLILDPVHCLYTHYMPFSLDSSSEAIFRILETISSSSKYLSKSICLFHTSKCYTIKFEVFLCELQKNIVSWLKCYNIIWIFICRTFNNYELLNHTFYISGFEKSVIFYQFDFQFTIIVTITILKWRPYLGLVLKLIVVGDLIHRLQILPSLCAPIALEKLS